MTLALLEPRAPSAAPAPRRFQLVVIMASAGGVPALLSVLAALPVGFPLPVAVAVMHRSPSHPGLLENVLARQVRLPLKPVEDAEPLEPGVIYVAPADLRVRVGPGRTLRLDPVEEFAEEPSPSALFESAAETMPRGVLAVVLAGRGREGSEGLRAVKAAGGYVLGQDPLTGAPVGNAAIDQILRLEQIPARLCELAGLRHDHG